jgi:AraC-like DNA-binding protein
MTEASLLRETRFSNKRLASVGIELLRLEELFARVPYQRLAVPERVEFCLVMVISGGRGEHVVDFQRVALGPGVVVLARPGTVQQWRPSGRLQGDVLLIEPQLIQPMSESRSRGPELRMEEWPECFVLDGRDLARWTALSDLLRDELDREDLDDLAVSTARELQKCMLLTLARGARQSAPSASVQDLLCRSMMRALDRLVATRPTVDSLALHLHSSPSTLGRACRASLGLSVKEVVDRRIALEAKRLLVHTQASAVAVSLQLGFSEPTNFLKFFKRCVGMTPEQFRQSQR